MFSCNNAADAIDRFIFVLEVELVVLLELVFVSECRDGGSTASSPFISEEVLVSCICRLFFSLMIALSKEFNVDLLDREELCSCIVELVSWAVASIVSSGVGSTCCGGARGCRVRVRCSRHARYGVRGGCAARRD